MAERNALTADICGESHGEAIGVRLGGLPAGEVIDLRELAAFMARRAPGGSGSGDEARIARAASTSRREPDEVEVTAGVLECPGQPGCVVTDGSLFEAVIRNRDQRPEDYDALRTVLRPGHADLGVYLQTGAEGLRPGGGRHSGRMTAPLCIAGGVASQILARRGIRIRASVAEIGGIRLEGEPGGTAYEETLDRICDLIDETRAKGDSLGGVVQCTVSGMPAGIGGALFDGFERDIASWVFAVPAVRGIEFGSGFSGARSTGLQNNDPIILKENGLPGTETNRAGGLSGGITTGADIFFRAAFKPTPTIRAEQRTVDISEGKEVTVSGTGRHDVCIVPRAVPVIEAVTALAVLDRLLAEDRPDA